MKLGTALIVFGALLHTAQATAAAQSAGAGAGLPCDGSLPSWMEGWSPLSPAADLPRRLPGAPRLPDLIALPAPRVGLFWTAGIPGGLPFELADSRTEFRAQAWGISGDYRRPLDPGQALVGGLSALGWRPLGERAAAIGRVSFDYESLDPSSYAHVLRPYPSSPLVSTDTSAPAVRRSPARLEAAAGWRLGAWGVGLAVGYQAVDNRSRRTGLPRIGRAAVSGVRVGLARTIGARGLRVGAYGRWLGGAETVSIAALSQLGVAHELKGYAEPEPIDITALYRRRIEHDTRAAGLAAAGAWHGISWTLFAERARHEETQSSQERDDPAEDRWRATATTVAGAAQAQVSRRGALATVDARWIWLNGSAERADLTGGIFRAQESALVVSAEVRQTPSPGGWGYAVGVSVRREARTRRDVIAEFGTEIEGWVHGATLEFARSYSDRVFASAGYAGSVYWRTATLPDPAALSPIYQRLIAPELAVYATEAAAHSAALTLRWRASGSTSLCVQGRYTVLYPRGVGPPLEFLPDGNRVSWSLALTVVLAG